MEQIDSPDPEQQVHRILRADGGEEELHKREERPNGLLYFTRYDSVPIMTKSLFGLPSNREFTKSELAEKSNLSLKTVSDRITILVELGIIKSIDGTNRYCLNLDSDITWKIRELDSLIKKSKPDTEKKEIASHDSSGDASKMVDPEPDAAGDVMETVRTQIKHAD